MNTSPRRATAQAVIDLWPNPSIWREPIDSSDESSLTIEQSQGEGSNNSLLDAESENTKGQKTAYESEESIEEQNIVIAISDIKHGAYMMKVTLGLPEVKSQGGEPSVSIESYESPTAVVSTGQCEFECPVLSSPTTQEKQTVYGEELSPTTVGVYSAAIIACIFLIVFIIWAVGN